MSASFKTIVITGCSTGFGRVAALHLARHGWRVFAAVRKESDRESLSNEAAAHGLAGRLFPMLCDITHAAQVFYRLYGDVFRSLPVPAAARERA